jgi:hypothetical protein
VASWGGVLTRIDRTPPVPDTLERLRVPGRRGGPSAPPIALVRNSIGLFPPKEVPSTLPNQRKRKKSARISKTLQVRPTDNLSLLCTRYRHKKLKLTLHTHSYYLQVTQGLLNNTRWVWVNKTPDYVRKTPHPPYDPTHHTHSAA